MPADDRYGPPPTGPEVASRALNQLRDRLPAGWTFEDEAASATLTAPDGRRAQYALRGWAHFRTRGTMMQVDEPDGAEAPRLLVVDRYLTKAAQDRLSALGVSYADATGNAWLASDDPAVLIIVAGATADPWRGPGRPLSGLRGDPASLVVRALTDTPRQWRVTELRREALVGVGSVYRVLDLLREEGLVERTDDGLVRVVDPAELVRRWAADNRVRLQSRVGRWLAPRGVDRFLEALRNSDVEYAVSGSAAARELVPDIPVKAAAVHIRSANVAAARLGLRPAETGVNVLLYDSPPPFVALRRSAVSRSGLKTAAPAQIVADMLTGPGREPEEAEALMEWMKTNGHWG